MSDPNAPSPATRAAHIAAFGLLYALAALVARTLLARRVGASPELAFYAGALVAVPFDVLLGALLAWPIGKKPASFGARVASGVPAMLLLALHVVVTPRLPGTVTRSQLEAGGVQALGAGLMLGAVLLAGLSPLAAKLEQRYATRAGRIADMVALGLLACLAIGASVGAYDDLYAGAVHPAWHLALEPDGRATPEADPVQEQRHHEHEHDHEHDENPQRRYAPGDRMIEHNDPPSTDGRPPGDIRVMSAVLHQGDALEPVPDTGYPYCVERARGGNPPGGEALPSVILLVLRDVGMRELLLDQPSGEPVMPLLRRLSEEAVLFDDVMAAGETDEDVLLAVLSGQPPSPEGALIADPAIPYLPGVARDLRDVGYETAFFDGVRDLLTHRQSYLRSAGFTTLDTPPLGALHRPDDETYLALQTWLEAHSGGGSRFVVMQGLGRPPEQLERGVSTDDIDSLRTRLAYTDAQLEAFYTWYAQHERPRGTVLMIMGDHPSPVVLPGDPATPTTGTGHELHFRVPLFVTGLPPAQERALRERSSRLGAQTDLPRTLLGLARDPRIGCYFGRDLFADGEWPVRRAPLSIGGDSRQFLVAHDGDTRWLYNITTRGMRIHDRAADPRFERDLFSEDDPEYPRMTEYLGGYVGTQRYVRRTRHYMPVPELPEGQRPAAGQPQRISDRGLLGGLPAAGEEPVRQSHEEVAAAEEAGFESILLDLQMTREREFVTIGATQLMQLGQGVNVNVEDVTREQLATLQRPAPTALELLEQHPRMRFVFQVHKPQRPELRQAWFAALVTMFHGLPRERVTLATVDSVVAGLLVVALGDAGVPVALIEAPQNAEGALIWLQTARALGVDWLYLPPTTVNAAVLETAQRWGVRIGLTGVTGPGAVLPLVTAGVAPGAYVASRAFILDQPTQPTLQPTSPRTPAAP